MRGFASRLVLLASLVFFTSGFARLAHEVVAHEGQPADVCAASCDHGMPAHADRTDGEPGRPARLPGRATDTKCPMCLMFSTLRPAPTLAAIAVVIAQPTPEELFAPVDRPVEREPARPGRPRAPPAA